MPGSPPTSTSDPGTIPPPTTKSNSSRPVRQRALSSPATSARRRGAARPAPSLHAPGGRRPSCRPRGRARVVGSSASVFHAPQAGHCPCQRGVSFPHSVQKNAVLTLAIPADVPLAPRGVTPCVVGRGRSARSLRLLAVRERLEPRALLAEEELHDAGRPVALLADDQLRPALESLLLRLHRRNVILRTVQEHDQIGILLERAGLAQVRELRPVVRALLGRTRELREREDRHRELLAERLQATADLADLLLPVLGVP